MPFWMQTFDEFIGSRISTTVIIEKVRPMYNKTGHVSNDIIDAIEMVGFLKNYAELQGYPVVMRQPQQRTASLNMIKARMVGKYVPNALHYIDAHAHAVSYMIETDPIATSEMKRMLSVQK